VADAITLFAKPTLVARWSVLIWSTFMAAWTARIGASRPGATLFFDRSLPVSPPTDTNN
jgi:hypothetical protein